MDKNSGVLTMTSSNKPLTSHTLKGALVSISTSVEDDPSLLGIYLGSVRKPLSEEFGNQETISVLLCHSGYVASYSIFLGRFELLYFIHVEID